MKVFLSFPFFRSGGGEGGLVGWLIVWGLTALRDSISVHIGPSPRDKGRAEGGGGGGAGEKTG